MVDRIAKYRVWIIAIVVVVSIISGPLTGKGSNSFLWRTVTPLIMGLGLPFFYALFSPMMITIEKIVLPPIVGFISLFVALVPYDRLIDVLGFYDSDYDRMINTPLANLVYYVPVASMAVCALYLFERYRWLQEVNR
jgi:hypothetical protein